MSHASPIRQIRTSNLNRPLGLLETSFHMTALTPLNFNQFGPSSLVFDGISSNVATRDCGQKIMRIFFTSPRG
ncbi:MAG: hypothetical protein ACXAC6_00300 [Candidatus Hodarchaeales archaeon]